MPVINVKGLGQVRIKGDTPTEAERQNMLAEIERRAKPQDPERAPTQTEFTPEQIESAGFGGLAQTMRGFQQLEDPPGFTDVLGNMARAPLARFGKVATDATAGLLKSASEAALGAKGYDPRAIFRADAEGRPPSPELVALRAAISGIGGFASEARDASVEAIDASCRCHHGLKPACP